MNAKDTLKKIAEALNIVSGEAKEIVSEAIQEAAESIDPTPEPKNARVDELEKQLADLKEILKNAMTQPEVIEAPIVEAPEPKGLTHSPEAPVAKKTASGVGRKGGSIQERVNRYINNN